MMKRRSRGVTKAILVLLAAAVVWACFPPGGGEGPEPGDAETGSIRLAIADSMARSIAPPPEVTDIFDYAITGVGPGGATIPDEPVILGGSGEAVYGLVPGAWTITVVGRNQAGEPRGVGGGTADVQAGQTATVAVTVTEYMEPNGAFYFEADWEAGVVDAPWIKSTLSDFTSFGIEENWPVSGTSTNYTHDGLHPGWWTWQVRLYNDPDGENGQPPVLMGGRAEAVRIVADYLTEADVWIHAVDSYGQIELILETDTYETMELTGSPAFSNISTLMPPDPLDTQDKSTWITVAPGETMEFMVAGPVPISAAFYLQGEQVQVGNTTYTLDTSGLIVGEHYVLDVVGFTTDHSQAGSSSWIVEIVEDVTATPEPLRGSLLVLEDAGVLGLTFQDTPGGWTVGGTLGIGSVVLDVTGTYDEQTGDILAEAQWNVGAQTTTYQMHGQYSSADETILFVQRDRGGGPTDPGIAAVRPFQAGTAERWFGALYGVVFDFAEQSLDALAFEDLPPGAIPPTGAWFYYNQSGPADVEPYDWVLQHVMPGDADVAYPPYAVVVEGFTHMNVPPVGFQPIWGTWMNSFLEDDSTYHFGTVQGETLVASGAPGDTFQIEGLTRIVDTTSGPLEEPDYTDGYWIGQATIFAESEPLGVLIEPTSGEDLYIVQDGCLFPSTEHFEFLFEDWVEPDDVQVGLGWE
jgi:hypothetical protein